MNAASANGVDTILVDEGSMVAQSRRTCSTLQSSEHSQKVCMQSLKNTRRNMQGTVHKAQKSELHEYRCRMC